VTLAEASTGDEARRESPMRRVEDAIEEARRESPGEVE
tara:strand:- start:619 stop:732 length:114 start_codon:yes stop_codon:yes gene_type:complete